ncbi:MAG: twin-arginine translocation signal domain-containing protein [Chloroflexi bacterium]|nr:twin-arginine translocation signal domain-containing protein [Chloroflexota bacterium]
MKALSRRDFLKLSGAAFASTLLSRSWRSLQANNPAEWPAGVPLGRVTPKRIRLVSRPHPDGGRLDYKYVERR